MHLNEYKRTLYWFSGSWNVLFNLETKKTVKILTSITSGKVLK